MNARRASEPCKSQPLILPRNLGSVALLKAETVSTVCMEILSALSETVKTVAEIQHPAATPG
jgi:hypothetical protein